MSRFDSSIKPAEAPKTINAVNGSRQLKNDTATTICAYLYKSVEENILNVQTSYTLHGVHNTVQAVCGSLKYRLYGVFGMR